MYWELTAAVGLLGAAYLSSWPVPIRPNAWSPQAPPPRRGPLAPNDQLAQLERLAPTLHGAEDVAIDAEGRLYCGTLDGHIHRVDPSTGVATAFAATPGRPLGLTFDRRGNLIVADACGTLLSIDQTGLVNVLTDAVDGRPLNFLNAAVIAPDGSILFTESSRRFALNDFADEVSEHGANGGLLRFSPSTNTTTTITDRLYFANGVALHPDGESALVCESSTYRVVRVWYRGAKQGAVETWLDNLPGFPDNINASPKGFWIAIVAPRMAIVDWLMPRPRLRKMLRRLPTWLTPEPAAEALIVEASPSGKLLCNLRATGPGTFAAVSSVRQVGSTLYLGSMSSHGIGRFELTPPLNTESPASDTRMQATTAAQ
jgi:sugar lactone lactonase YvrE